MGIFKRFMRYFAKNTIKRAEDYKTPCNPNAHWDRKRCKSCKFFIPNDTLAKCENGGIVSPLQKACKNYVKSRTNLTKQLKLF